MEQPLPINFVTVFRSHFSKEGKRGSVSILDGMRSYAARRASKQRQEEKKKDQPPAYHHERGGNKKINVRSSYAARNANTQRKSRTLIAMDFEPMPYDSNNKAPLRGVPYCVNLVVPISLSPRSHFISQRWISRRRRRGSKHCHTRFQRSSCTALGSWDSDVCRRICCRFCLHLGNASEQRHSSTSVIASTGGA